MTATHTPIYAEYAALYDMAGQGRFGEIMAHWALGWLREHGPLPTRALDLACGTGAAALVLAASGCQIVGVDQSEPMLDIARGKSRDAGLEVAFVAGDIRDMPNGQHPANEQQLAHAADWSFVLGPSSFDLVTCFTDSLNYLTDESDLAAVFGGVYRALRDGGHFCFDLNTEAEFATWDERDAVSYDGPSALIYNRLSFDPDTRMGSGRIVWFVREIDLWWRGEETHRVRAWSDNELRAALGTAGLVVLLREDVPDTDGRRSRWIARRGGAVGR